MLPRKHKWEDSKRILPSESFDGNERMERICKLCGLIKITVHPPSPDFPWREWRTPTGKTVQFTSTPPCLERVSDLSGTPATHCMDGLAN